MAQRSVLIGRFEHNAPTAEFSAELAALSAGMNAPQLVELAESVADMYALQMDPLPPLPPLPPDEKYASFRTQLHKDCGLDKPYTPDNDFGIWRALVWMGISDEQWAAIALHWKDGSLNPHAMHPPFIDRLDTTAPIVMIIAHRKRNELTVVHPPCRPELAIQIGGGVLSDEKLAAFHAMVADKREGGGPPYYTPPLALVHGVPYYRDDCQWSSGDMREVQMRSERELHTRIWLQFIGDRSGYYVPMY